MPYLTDPHTVRDVATFLRVVPDIERAFSFQPLQTGGLWRLPVSYNPRLGSRAGQYKHNPPAIELHCALAGPNTSHAEHVATFLHELAHAMEHAVYNSHGHGTRWWQMMHQLGQQPKRTHNIAACTKYLSTKADTNPDDLGL